MVALRNEEEFFEPGDFAVARDCKFICACQLINFHNLLSSIQRERERDA